MTLDLFAGIRVGDIAAAMPWYERLLGGEPTFMPHDKEAVWELAEHRFLYVTEDPDGPGRALQTIFVDDLEGRVGEIAERGISPVRRKTYSNGVGKATYRDPEGNEFGIGGTPADGAD
jgi:predicted enzyme related to lactoylglutathione lyase